MSDFLLELSKNKSARKLIKSLGLPIPMPAPLRRAAGPVTERPLDGRQVVFGSASAGDIARVIARTLITAGAEPLLVGGQLRPLFADLAEAYGRPTTTLSLDGDIDARPAALVMNAAEIDSPRQLARLHELYHPLIRSLDRCGRVVVIGRLPASAPDASAAAASEALSGFVRSLAKEIGRHGSTAQLVRVATGAEDHLEAVLRFLLSDRSAFVSGQVLEVSAAGGAAAAAPWTRSLEGKVALVTGAARGIGAATARELAAEGARVLCLDRPTDDEPLSRIAREIGGEVLAVDVATPEAPAQISAAIRERAGGVDVVVHNAGITRDKTLAKMDRERWDQVIDVNLVAVDAITRALVAEEVIRPGGRIICLSSVAGIAGNMGQTNYAASKAGVIGLVRRLAADLAARDVAAVAVAPGFIETRLTARIPTIIREVGRRLSALGQGGLPEDVARVIGFLASPGGGGLSGQVVRVCGGAFIGA
jgi:3-oxoacyl-[acyl-carrier protein] reductase